MASEKSTQDLKTLLNQGIQSVISFSPIISASLTSRSKPSSITPDTEEKPISQEYLLSALSDIAKLSKAHSTKIAIAFKPPIANDAAYKCLDDLVSLTSPVFSVYISAVNQDSKDNQKISKLVLKKVKTQILALFSSLNTFYTQLLEICSDPSSAEEHSKTENNDNNNNTLNNGRLVVTGKLWESCDALINNPSNLKPSKLLAQEVNKYADLILDAVTELEQNGIDSITQLADEGFSEDSVATNGGNTNRSSILTLDSNSTPADVERFAQNAAKVEEQFKNLSIKKDTVENDSGLSAYKEASPVFKYKLALEKLVPLLQKMVIPILERVSKYEERLSASSSSQEKETEEKDLLDFSHNTANAKTIDEIALNAKQLSENCDDFVATLLYSNEDGFYGDDDDDENQDSSSSNNNGNDNNFEEAKIYISDIIETIETLAKNLQKLENKNKLQILNNKELKTKEERELREKDADSKINMVIKLKTDQVVKQLTELL